MPKDLDELRERKKELLLESEINRQILAIEASQVKLKAVQWRRNLMKAGAIYKWVAPLAGVGFGFLAARKHVKKAEERASHHGNGHARKGKMGYMSLLAPLGIRAATQAFEAWRRTRSARTAE